MDIAYENRRVVVGILSTLVVLGVIGMDEFVEVIVGIEGCFLEVDSVSESFLIVLNKTLGCG